MNTLEKGELTTSVFHTDRFSKSEIPILKSQKKGREEEEIEISKHQAK